MAMVSFIAGACISTADLASSYMAPSTMSAQCTSSATGTRIEAEALLRDHGDETGAGLETRVVKLAVALILLEMGGVGRREKGAFVVIEPPGNVGRTGVFEIDNRVLIAVKLLLVEKSAGSMQQAGIDETLRRRGSAPGKNAKTGLPSKPRQNTCRDKTPALANGLPLLASPGVE